MRKSVLLAVLLGLSASDISFGQSDSDFIVITSKKEDPKALNIIALEIPIWHMNGSLVNSSLYNIKTSLSYVGAGKVNGGATFNWRVFDRIYPSSYDDSDYGIHEMMVSKFKAPAAQSLDVWVAYFFKEKLVPTKERVQLKRAGNTTYYTNVDTKAYKRTGVELGYSQGFTWYNMNNMRVAVEEPNSGSKRFFESNSQTTVQTFKVLKVGLIFTKAVNVNLEVEGYGTKRSGYVNQNSFNLLFAVQNRFDDVLVGYPNTSNNSLEFTRYNFSDDNKRLPLGFEYKFKKYSKGWFSYEAGAGYYPGLLKKINLGVFAGVSIQIDMLIGNKLK